jgi:hypothetical protein
MKTIKNWESFNENKIDKVLAKYIDMTGDYENATMTIGSALQALMEYGKLNRNDAEKVLSHYADLSGDYEDATMEISSVIMALKYHKI